MTNAAPPLTIRVGCEFTYRVSDPATAILLVRPLDGASQRRAGEQWDCAPQTTVHDYVDAYGNRPQRLVFRPPAATFRYSARVEVPASAAETDWNAREVPVGELPDDVLPFTLPSRFCLSDTLSQTAWDLFSGVEPGWTRVQTICDWVHRHLRFAYGSSSPTTSALDVYESGVGVCRDFAHLAVTFCRALNIPARYTFGYLPDIGVPPPDAPMDFCSWFEAYLDGRWWTFDPRNNQRRIGHIVIARGRDAIDVAMVTTYGAAAFESMTVWADQELA